MHDVIIIGAGISGLTAAIHLEEQGYSPLIIEGTSRVGGRVKTDVIDGFRMDRGFQVLLPSYPEVKKNLDIEALDLKYFSPGAKILMPGGSIETISDPLREWTTLLTTVFSRVGNIHDKIAILKLKRYLDRQSIDEIFVQKEITTQKFLQKFGFSDEMIGLFFQPFFAGIFLESKMTTSANMFQFIFKMFGEVSAAIPARGMGEIPVQLKSKLEQTTFHFNERVTHIEGQKVYTNKHETYEAKAILIATEATGLIRQYMSDLNTNYNSTSCIYFSAPATEVKNMKRYIAINAQKTRLINNVAVMSNVSTDYAPAGKALVSCGTVGLAPESNDEFIPHIKTELKQYLGVGIQHWQHLKTYHIPYALPTQLSVKQDISEEKLKIRNGLFVAGDHLLNSSLNAAMRSGRKAAQVIGQHLR